jgi:hypothetical protein
VSAAAESIGERLRDELEDLSRLEDYLDSSIDSAAGVLAFAALAVCLRIVWDVPMYMTVVIGYPIMILYGLAFDQDINKVKKSSDKLPPDWEL